jgi:hypothetical protein
MAAQAALIPHAGNVPTFQTTTESYLTHGGEGRYLPPIVEYFADTPITAITPFDVKQMALALYPDCLNSTRNRQALTPARAVLFHGYERGWCHAMRLRSFKEDAPRRKSPASPVWLHIFCRQADADGLQRLSALVLFMAQTGARVSEAVALGHCLIPSNSGRRGAGRGHLNGSEGQEITCTHRVDLRDTKLIHDGDVAGSKDLDGTRTDGKVDPVLRHDDELACSFRSGGRRPEADASLRGCPVSSSRWLR